MLSRELCEQYGPHLYDYCRTELGEADAELAAAGTLRSAAAHAARVADPALLRPWLYALARVHRANTAAARPASTGSWSRPGRMSDLLPEALIALDGPHRELLDLSVRHALPHAEIAAIFSVDAWLVDALVAEAGDRLETWLAAVTAARAADGCPQLAGRVAEWAAAPSRSTRARIGRHLTGCADCLAVPRGLPAAVLLAHLPIAAPRGSLPDLLPVAEPLPADDGLWRADGFPVQSHTLAEAAPTTPFSHVADPTTAAGDGSGPAAGAAAAGPEPSRASTSAGPAVEAGAHPYGLTPVASGQEPVADDEFRAWERRGARWEEFWKDRPDEADPEARITVRSVLRVGVLVGAGVLVAGLAWSGIHARPRPTTVTEAAAPRPQPLVTLTTEPEADPQVEVPPEDVTTLQPEDTPGQRDDTGVPPDGSPTSTPPDARPTRTAPPTSKPATSRPTAKPTPSDPGGRKDTAEPKRNQDPPDPPKQPTSAPPTKPVAKKVELPKPQPPTASLSSSSADLGSGRSGSFSLSCTGSCQVTSASGSNGINVSGTSYSVDAPPSKPGCPGPATRESGTITVSWSGTATGDGSTTEGTSNGGGTLTLSVSWSVAKDKGVFVPDMKGGGYWSNCSPNSKDY